MKTLISGLLLISFILFFTKRMDRVELAQVPRIEHFYVTPEISTKKEDLEMIKTEIRLIQSDIRLKIKINQ